MNKSEQLILSSRTADEYVVNSIKSKLPPAQKARLAREWMKKTGFTRADILYARNRHPYWKQKKMENSDVRARRRLAEYDYSSGTGIEWTNDLVAEFLSLNGVDKEGRYLKRDRELAEHFKTTIPSIQYMRRKFRAVKRMLGDKASRSKLVDFLGCSESLLRKGIEAVEAYAARKPAEKRQASSKVQAQKSTVVKKSSSANPAGKKSASARKPVAKKTVTTKTATKPSAKKAVAKKAAVKKTR